MSNPLDVAQWAKNWEAMARQAQASFGGGAGQATWPGSQPTSNPWADTFTQAKPFASGAQQSAAIEHMMAGAQGYLGMLQSLASGAMGQAAVGMQNPFANGFSPGMASASGMDNPFAAAMRGFGAQGARGFEQLMEQFSAAAGPMLDQAKASMHLPAFGHLREKQENLQKTAQVFLDYQQQSARYDRLMLKVGEHSFARFQLKLAEREEPGRQIDSARGLYDLWIDAAEEAYAEIALSEEFREIYAAVVDAQMRVRQQVQGEIERFCNQLGMPTRSEVNSIGERLQTLRREFREQQESSEDEDALRAELLTLKRELAALKDTSSNSAKAPKSERKSKSAKAKKNKKSSKLIKSAESALRVEAKPDADVVKPSKTKTRKSTSAHRGKRRKAVSAKRSSSKKTADTGTGEFAASIARFAARSKSTAKRGSTGATQKSAKRGGSK